MLQRKKEEVKRRHFEFGDLLKVREVTKEPSDVIEISYLLISAESENFAKELQTELSKYYNQVILKPTNTATPIPGSRMMIAKIGSVVYIYLEYVAQ